MLKNKNSLRKTLFWGKNLKGIWEKTAKKTTKKPSEYLGVRKKQQFELNQQKLSVKFNIYDTYNNNSSNIKNIYQRLHSVTLCCGPFPMPEECAASYKCLVANSSKLNSKTKSE